MQLEKEFLSHYSTLYLWNFPQLWIIFAQYWQKKKKDGLVFFFSITENKQKKNLYLCFQQFPVYAFSVQTD